MKRILSVTLLAFFTILILVSLGRWQWFRAHEKESMIRTQAHYDQIAPRKWRSKNGLPQQYERIQLRGTYAKQVFLLDNQYVDHQWGYHVLSPLQLVSGEWLIVDRGWVKGDPSRHRWPKIAIPKGEIVLEGQAYYPSARNWVLSNNLEVVKPELVVIEKWDNNVFLQILNQAVQPFLVRLHHPQTMGYQLNWPVVSMAPEKHYAYAWQWFGLALLVLIYWGYYVTKKK